MHPSSNPRGKNRNLVFILPASRLLLSGLLTTALAIGGQAQYYTGDNTRETEFNLIPKTAQRASRDLTDLPAAYSLKNFAPPPGNQGKNGTCVAWSAGYGARTISYCIAHGLTDPQKIRAAAFSPSYLYYYLKAPGDSDCQLGATIEPALKILAARGDLPFSQAAAGCISQPDGNADSEAKNYQIKTYSSLTNIFGRISKNEILAIKKSIAEKKPVIVSLKCYSSLMRAGADGAWNPGTDDQLVGNHAVCITGYDDNKFGGALEVLNSWGSGWGNQGFGWLTYDQLMNYGSYALELMDREVYDGTGNRDLGPPRLKGSLDFVLTNDSGRDLALMPVVRSLVDALGRPAGPEGAVFSNYRFSGTYAAGEIFKIRFSTNAPAFIYIFSLDELRNVSLLFPYADNISPAINSPDATVYLPAETKHYRLDADTHRDRICVLYSKSALDFPRLQRQVAAQTGTLYQTIQAQYQQQLIPAGKIKFQDSRISFEVPAAETELLCFFVDLNHS